MNELFWWKKRRQQKIERSSFVLIVKNLFGGIHELDRLISKVNHERDYSYDTIALIERSTEDLINLCSIYKGHRLFHAYYLPTMDCSLRATTECFRCIEEHARNFEYTMNNIRDVRGMQQMYGETDETMMAVEEMRIELVKYASKLHASLINLRSILLQIRAVVSEDYLKILSGVNLEHTFLDEESMIRNNKILEVRFDKYEIKKFGKNKEVTTDEHK